MKLRKNKPLKPAKPVKIVDSYFENCRVYTNFIEPGSFPVQAKKASPAEVRLHIVRQRFLGERMIGEQEYPRRPGILATALMILAMLVYSAYRGWL